MQKKVIALTDYKNNFGSKHFDTPYRSGMEKNLLYKFFLETGYELEFIQFTEIINKDYLNTDVYYIYTSSEDNRYLYKSFIEDAVLYLEISGCKVIPSFKYLRANNNKVFMELLRNNVGNNDLLSIRSRVFGTKQELMKIIDKIVFPVVIKSAEGAGGSGVFKANTRKELIKIVNKISFLGNIEKDLWDFGRSLKHKGYIKETRYRYKFIVQNMIESLANDWKVYYFMDKLYVFYRPILKHRVFKASGGGYDNYKYDENAPKPNGFFNFIERIIENFNVPHASMDIAWDGQKFHLIEIQFVYFGTAGIPYSKGYYSKQDGNYQFIESKISIEEVYASSITQFIAGLPTGNE